MQLLNFPPTLILSVVVFWNTQNCHSLFHWDLHETVMGIHGWGGKIHQQYASLNLLLILIQWSLMIDMAAFSITIIPSVC